MNRAAVATLVMPFAAAAVFGALVVATHHTTVPPLSPSAFATPAPASTPARCGREIVREPFAGIAVSRNVIAQVRVFRRATGADIRLVAYSSPFTRPFNPHHAQQVAALGALPLAQLDPRGISLRRIADGRYNWLVRRYADAVRAFGCRVVLSFGHDMNAWWNSWGMPHTRPATFIAAWRRIHDVFRQEGAGNVIWSWDPSHLEQQVPGKVATSASEWYPGDAYVDWIGLDGSLGPGQTFDMAFGRQLDDIRRVTRKPVYLAATAVAAGKAQPRAITALFAAARRHHLIGLVWSDISGWQSAQLAGRPASLAAFRRAVAALR